MSATTTQVCLCSVVSYAFCALGSQLRYSLVFMLNSDGRSKRCCVPNFCIKFDTNYVFVLFRIAPVSSI